MDIGKKIIELREKKNWSQKELAARIGLNQSVMNRIESGERPLRADELKKLVQVLDTTADDIIGNTQKLNAVKKTATSLTEKDEKDIAKRMEKIKRDLIEANADGDGLNFMGEPMGPEAIESLLEALEHAERIATLTNKKFIPKKFRDED